MKKVKWIALALVLCLGLIGGAYATWTDTLFVDMNVQSGEMNVRFTSAGLASGGGVYNETIGASVDTSDYKTVTVDLDNLIPKNDPDLANNTEWTVKQDGYLWTSFTVINDGDAPAIVESVDITHTGSNAMNHVRFGRGETTGMNYNGLKTHLENGMSAGPPLEPGQEHETTVFIWLNADTPNVFQDSSGTIDITFNFEVATEY